MRRVSSSTAVAAVLGLLLVGSSAAGGSLSFASAVSYGAHSGPAAAGAGDLNGDGRPDLAIANFSSSDASVLLGNGDGTFQAPVNYGAGSGSFGIAVHDLNLDGKLDLAVTNYTSNDVSVLLNKGDATFQPAANYATGNGPVSVVVGDLNGDAKPDLVTGNMNSDDASVLLGNGDGTFQAPVSYLSDNVAYGVALGDLNADGSLDVVVSNLGAANASVLLGNGDGTFRPAVYYDTDAGPEGLALRDLNGDGKLDLATANYGQNNVSVLLGNGDGTFEPMTTYHAATSPVGMEVADFNGDGWPDLAATNLGSKNVSVFLGNGDGTFQAAANFGTGDGPYWPAVADLNGDGRPDLAVPNSNSNDVSVLLNTTGLDTTPPVITITPGPQDTVASTGWFNRTSSGTDGVEVEVTATDPSGVAHLTCTDGVATTLDVAAESGSFTIHDGTHSISCTAEDAAGNKGAGAGSTAMPSVFKVDQTSSVITIATSAEDTVASTGWFNRASSGTDGVAVGVSASDTSGVTRLTCTDGPATTLDIAAASSSLTVQDGTHSITCATEDAAGNEGAADGSTAMPVVLKVDETSPTLAPTVSPNPVLLHGMATVSATASDVGSGIAGASVSCGPVDSTSVGVKQVVCSAKDVAGNSGQGTGTYTVGYKFLGFGPKPLATTWRQGSNLAAKFGLGDANGVRLSDTELKAIAAACRATMMLRGPNPSTNVAVVPVCAHFDSGTHMLAAQLKVPKLLASYTLVVDVYDTATPPNLITTAQQTITVTK